LESGSILRASSRSSAASPGSPRRIILSAISAYLDALAEGGGLSREVPPLLLDGRAVDRLTDVDLLLDAVPVGRRYDDICNDFS
jgi:hypothetical protein